MNLFHFRQGSLKNSMLIIGGLLFCGIITTAAISEPAPAKTATEEISQKIEPVVTPAVKTEVNPLVAEKKEIISKLRVQASNDWPNDHATQEFWVKEQVEDYEYMKSIADSDPFKQQASEVWPLDFSNQKYWYDEQVKGKAKAE